MSNEEELIRRFLNQQEEQEYLIRQLQEEREECKRKIAELQAGREECKGKIAELQAGQTTLHLIVEHNAKKLSVTFWLALVSALIGIIILIINVFTCKCAPVYATAVLFVCGVINIVISSVLIIRNK